MSPLPGPIPYAGPTGYPTRAIRLYEQRFRRQRHNITYGFADLRIADTTPNGLCYVNQGELLFVGGDNQPRSPMICLHPESAGSPTTAVIAEASECYNAQFDPFAWTRDVSSTRWELPGYYSVVMVASTGGSRATVAGTYAGMGAGKFLKDAGATQNDHHLGLRWNHNAFGWEAVINNKFGPSGHRTFIRSMPDGAGGAHSWGVLQVFRLEILYIPGVQVSFFLNGGEATTMRDGDSDITPYTPIADMRANSLGNQIAGDRGITLFATVGTTTFANLHNEYQYWWPHIEIDASYLGYPYHS